MPSELTTVAAAARIEEIQALQNSLAVERGHLERLVSYPSVDVVLVYWRDGRDYREVVGDTLEEALRTLEYWSDDGYCAPVGVEVNGVLVEDWKEFSSAL